MSTEPALSLEDLTIPPGERLQGALRRMTRNRKGILFVCEPDLHLVGVLSDGDARRAMAEATMLASPVAKIMNLDPVSARSRDEAERLLAAHPLVAVPILDDRGTITEIVLGGAQGTRVLRADYVPLDEPVKPQQTIRSVAFIPARGGSKRIPRKNLRQVAGKSLLEWAIWAAKGARSIDYVFVSTDDDEIAHAAREAGAEVPWPRPSDLSTDTASISDVLVHEVERLRTVVSGDITWAVLLEPTAPMRRPAQIDECVRLLLETDADTVVSVCRLPHIFHPEEILAIREGRLEPALPGRTMTTRKLRGQQEPAFIPSGVAYAMRVASLLEHRHLFGPRVVPYETPWDEYVDIDDLGDLRRAEAALRLAFNV